MISGMCEWKAAADDDMIYKPQQSTRNIRVLSERGEGGRWPPAGLSSKPVVIIFPTHERPDFHFWESIAFLNDTWSDDWYQYIVN